MAWAILFVLTLLLFWVFGPAAGSGLLSSHPVLWSDSSGYNKEEWPAGVGRRAGFRGSGTYGESTHDRTATQYALAADDIAPRTNLLPGDRYQATMTHAKTGKRSPLETQLKVVAAGGKPPVPGRTRFSTIIRVQEIERVGK